MLKLKLTPEYSKTVDQMIADNVDLSPLDYVIGLLVKGKQLNPSYNDHALQNRLSQYRECHIEEDWLLIYKVEKKVLYLIATGTHAELFDR